MTLGATVKLLVLVCVVTAGAQVMLKHAATKASAMGLNGARVLVQPLVLCAYALLAITTVMNLQVYKVLDAKIFPAAGAITTLLVYAASYLIFRERFQTRQKVGIAAVVAGLLIFFI